MKQDHMPHQRLFVVEDKDKPFSIIYAWLIALSDGLDRLCLNFHFL